MNPYAMYEVGKARQRDLLEAARSRNVEREDSGDRNWLETLAVTATGLATLAVLIILVG